MDASRSARVLSGSGNVLAAAIHAACEGAARMAAGLDEIRKPASDHGNELEGSWTTTGSAGLGPTDLPPPRRSPSQLVEGWSARRYATAR
jgi:hypothetical protein